MGRNHQQAALRGRLRGLPMAQARRVAAWLGHGLRRAAAWGGGPGLRETLPEQAPHMSWPSRAFDDHLRHRARVHRADGLIRARATPGLISIVLPVYNGERFLAESINSVLAQTYPDWELIIVDDGSTDGSPAIAREFSARDARVRLITQPNARLPAALNAGFRAARGEYYTWTSDDNRLKPAFLERLVAELRARPGVDFVYANYEIIGDDGALLRDADWCGALQDPPGSGRIHPLPDVSTLNVLNSNYIGAAFLYRAHVHDLLEGYGGNWFSCEDYDFFLRANAEFTMRKARCAECLYEYRLHGGALSARHDELGRAGMSEQLIVFDDFRRDLARHPVHWRLRARGGARAAAIDESLARLAVERGDWVERVWDDANFRELPCGSPRLKIELIIDDHAEARVAESDATATAIAAGDGIYAVAHAASENGLHFQVLDLTRRQFSAEGAEALFRALLIRARATLARRFEGAIANSRVADDATRPASAKPRASVIICSNRFDAGLREVLAGLNEQTLPRTLFEVILVDNRPEYHPSRHAASIDAELAALGNLRLIHCHQPGLAFARNAGLLAAAGELVAYLDDDAIPRADWLQRLVDAFDRHPECGLIGGSIELRDPQTTPWWWGDRARRIWSHFVPAEADFHLVSAWREFPWGANWAARRHALLSVGGFRSSYGHCGSRAGGGEELVAALLLQRIGAGIGIEPAARVTHKVDPRRFRLANVWRAIRNGWLLRLQLERALYIDREISPVGLLKESASHLIAALAPGRAGHYERIEKCLWAFAALEVLVRFIPAQLARFRTPRYWLE